MQPALPAQPARPTQPVVPPQATAFVPSVVVWPTRLRGAAAPMVVLAVLAGGLASAVAVPLDRPGIGWLLAGLVITAGIAAAILRVDALRDAAGLDAKPAAITGDRIAAGIGALALVGIGAIRAADWLFVLCLLAALILAAIAAAGGHTWRALGFAPIAVPLAAFPGAAWIGRGLAPATSGPPGPNALPSGAASPSSTPGSSIATAAQQLVRRAPANPRRVLAIALVTALLLLVFGGLLASADTVFADLLDRITPDLSGASLFRGAFLLVAGAMLSAGLVYVIISPHRVGVDVVQWRRLSPLDWGLPLGALNALFAIFVWVQLGTMFGWHDYVLAPNGPDYADYARAGFGQLVTVTLLTFVVIAVVAHVASRRTAAERAWLRVLVGLLCLLSMVIVASALNRLWLYQDAYGLTRLRLVVGVGEAWLGVMFLLVMATGLTLRAGWLARAVVGVAAATLFALGVANPDALIAHWNVDRALEGRELAYGQPVDRLDYLSTLSADAIGAIDRLPEQRRSCLLARMAQDVERPDPWYAYNLGRERARALLEQRSYDRADCNR